MKNENYDSSKPLARLEKGDKAIIRFTRFPFAKEKDKQKYKDVQVGKYEAICTEPLVLECKEHPVLGGRFNYWRGDKWGCSEGIYADEIDS